MSQQYSKRYSRQNRGRNINKNFVTTYVKKDDNNNVQEEFEDLDDKQFYEQEDNNKSYKKGSYQSSYNNEQDEQDNFNSNQNQFQYKRGQNKQYKINQNNEDQQYKKHNEKDSKQQYYKDYYDQEQEDFQQKKYKDKFSKKKNKHYSQSPDDEPLEQEYSLGQGNYYKKSYNKKEYKMQYFIKKVEDNDDNLQNQNDDNNNEPEWVNYDNNQPFEFKQLIKEEKSTNIEKNKIPANNNSNSAQILQKQNSEPNQHKIESNLTINTNFSQKNQSSKIINNSLTKQQQQIQQKPQQSKHIQQQMLQIQNKIDNKEQIPQKNQEQQKQDINVDKLKQQQVQFNKIQENIQLKEVDQILDLKNQDIQTLNEENNDEEDSSYNANNQIQYNKLTKKQRNYIIQTMAQKVIPAQSVAIPQTKKNLDQPTAFQQPQPQKGISQILQNNGQQIQNNQIQNLNFLAISPQENSPTPTSPYQQSQTPPFQVYQHNQLLSPAQIIQQKNQQSIQYQQQQQQQQAYQQQQLQQFYGQNQVNVQLNLNVCTNQVDKQINLPFIGPFTSFALQINKDHDTLLWYYIDKFKNQQGPFESIKMDNWLQQGVYFPDDLPIAFQQTQYWTTLKEFLNDPSSLFPQPSNQIPQQKQVNQQSSSVKISPQIHQQYDYDQPPIQQLNIKQQNYKSPQIQQSPYQGIEKQINFVHSNTTNTKNEQIQYKQSYSEKLRTAYENQKNKDFQITQFQFMPNKFQNNQFYDNQYEQLDEQFDLMEINNQKFNLDDEEKK